MTQHPLQFDPSRKENDSDSLSDTWSQADTLLEELPKARKREETRRPDDEAQSAEYRRNGDAENLSPCVRDDGDVDNMLSRLLDRPRQGLLRKN